MSGDKRELFDERGYIGPRQFHADLNGGRPIVMHNVEGDAGHRAAVRDGRDDHVRVCRVGVDPSGVPVNREVFHA